MRKVLLALLALSLLIAPIGARAAVTPEEGYVTSFDGTPIHYYFFPPQSAPAPVILRTHGWGGSGESSEGTGALHKFLAAGYGVLTWDARGFGLSGGQAEIDDPAFEGRDVSALIDKIQPDARVLKVDGDPVLGMSGGSYAGGIQFVAASVDKRIDALAPEIAWHELPDALFPHDVPKFGWDTLLYAVAHMGYQGYIQNQTFTRGMIGTIDPRIHESFVSTTATNDPRPWRDFFAAHSIANVTNRVRIPTFIIQGTIDTLFPMNHGIANMADLERNDVPVKIEFYNAGHTLGSNVPGGDQRAHTDEAIIAWFDKYLKGEDVDTGPLVSYQDQNAAWHSLSEWPAESTKVVKFSGLAPNLPITPAPTGGGEPANANPDLSQLSAQIPIMTASSDTTVLGVPHLSGTISGVAPDAFLFFKLVDTDTGVVLDDQTTPYRASIVSTPEVNFSIDLNGVSWILPKGHHLALEISTGALSFANSRVPGLVSLSVSGLVPTL